MSAMDSMNLVVNLLKLQSWRDKTFRTLTYLCSLIAARNPNTKLSIKAARLGAAIGSMRAFTRLLDDVPMLRSTLQYGLGKKEESTGYRILQVVENAAYQLFFPAEHLALMCQLEILPVANKQKWAGRATMLWGLGLFCVISKNILVYMALLKSKARLQKAEPTLDKERTGSYSAQAKEIQSRLHITKLTLMKDMCDITNAINWFPGNFLWSGKLTSTQSSVFGLAASILGFRILRLSM